MRVFVEPEADRVLWLHVRVFRALKQGERRGRCVGPHRDPPVHLLICCGLSESYRWQGSTLRSEAMLNLAEPQKVISI
jgi:hypothetical protein